MPIYRCLELILLLFGVVSFIDQFLPDSLVDVDHADISIEHTDEFLLSFRMALFRKSSSSHLVNYFLTVYHSQVSLFRIFFST
jgi:hypothetical protein